MVRILLIAGFLMGLMQKTAAQCGGLASYYNVKVCQGGYFYTGYGSPAGSTWVWTGPNGFYSTNALLEVYNFQYKDTGIYRSCVTVPGCPVACAENQLVISLKKRTDISNSICAGGNYIFPSGTRVVGGVANATYLDTSVLASSERDERGNYCDSVIYTVLKVNDVIKTSIYKKTCTGSPYILPDGRVISNAGSYQFTFNLKSPAGCDSTLDLRLDIDTIYSSAIDAVICKNQQYVLPDGKIVTAAGTYSTVLTSVSGCDSVVTTNLKTSDGTYYDVYAPNAFSPNGDRVNDIYKIHIGDPSLFGYLKIFNRWGQVVFFSTDYLKGWDGTYNQQLPQTGSYIYVLRAQNCAGIWNNFSGNITLLR
jgi:gliding motility-associated-like protein